MNEQNGDTLWQEKHGQGMLKSIVLGLYSILRTPIVQNYGDTNLANYDRLGYPKNGLNCAARGTRKCSFWEVGGYDPVFVYTVWASLHLHAHLLHSPESCFESIIHGSPFRVIDEINHLDIVIIWSFKGCLW